MKKISLRARGWLKGFHILFASLWVGAAICMMLMTFVKGHISNGDELWAVNISIKLIDDFIIIPSALGCLFTGVLISSFTNWGFFKYHWVSTKYAITILAILFGTFFLGPWVNGMEAISAMERLTAQQNTTYVHYATMNKYFGTLQATVLIFALYISVFKPWGKRKEKKKISSKHK